MSDICQIRLGPNGLQEISKRDAALKFRDELSKTMVVESGLVLDSAKHKETLARLRRSRFFSFRDGSLSQRDVREDRDFKRRNRWLSISRDMTSHHVWDNAIAQELYRVPGNNSVPGFGRSSGDAGVNVERFADEADKLHRRGIIADYPDFTSDEAMVEFLGKVNDAVLNEAQGNYTGKNRVLDAAPGLYLFSELLKRTERLIKEDFTELWARRIFPILNLNTWLPQWMFQRIDDRGELPEYVEIERLPSNAQRGSENRDAEVRNLAFYFTAASWSRLELARYAEAIANGAANIQIDRRRIDLAIRMMNFKEDLITFFGDTNVNIFGLFSDEAKTGVERIPSADFGGAFGSGTPEVDRDLLIGAVKRIVENTEQVLAPDTLMLSTTSWTHVNTRLYGSVDSDAGSNKTVLEMAEQSLRKLGIRDILWVPEVGYSAQQETRLLAHGLSATEAQRYAGGDGDGLQSMVVCKRDADVMEMVVAKDRTMYPAQETRTDRVETRMMQGSGGLAIYKPEGVKIVTDVGPAAP